MNCKLCGSKNTYLLFYSKNTHGRHLLSEKDNFIVLECKDCSLVFLPKIVVNDAYYKKYYELDYYHQTGGEQNSILLKIIIFISKLSFKYKERIISKVINSKRIISILDIGCGEGNFLSQLDSNKFDKTGIEINKEGYAATQMKGINVFNQDISKVNFAGKKFDVISLWHVLEHIDEPKSLFKNIRKNLNDGGILIFQVPNTGSLGFRYGKQDWFHLDSPRHLMLYGIRSVKKLCELTGFEIMSIKNEFYDYPLDLFWSIRKSWIRFIIYPLYPIFKIFSKEHLTFICKKK